MPRAAILKPVFRKARGAGAGLAAWVVNVPDLFVIYRQSSGAFLQDENGKLRWSVISSKLEKTILGSVFPP